MIAVSWGLPSSKKQAACIANTRQGGYNYDHKYVGSTRQASNDEEHRMKLENDGYAVNKFRVELGKGELTFEKGREKLKTWSHFQLGWASVDPSTPIKAGQRFCVCVNETFLWILSPLQVIYVDDTYHGEKSSMQPPQKMPGPIQEKNSKGIPKGVSSFGSGTLEGHLLAGEELFAVKWEDDDSVWYEVFSFSKPAKLLSRVTYPYVRWRQRCFAQQSSNAMLRAVDGTA